MRTAAAFPFPTLAGESLKPYATLRAGGPAEHLAICRTIDECAIVARHCQRSGVNTVWLGMGSNVLPSDLGVHGLVAIQSARDIEVRRDGTVLASAGAVLQEVFLKTAQHGLKGLQFAVGIPGTVGGALVSNAGAYRSNISDHLMEIEIVFEGERQWVEPAFLQFSYRDSILRRPDAPAIVLLSARFQFDKGNPKSIYDEARDYQRQRISKQPPQASAGSFFKNVNDPVLANRLDGLAEPLRKAGVVPSGYLIEAAGLKGYRLGGAVIGPKHANFIVNLGDATATEIRRLAELAKTKVHEHFGVWLEEEVLYLGDWSEFEASQ